MAKNEVRKGDSFTQIEIDIMYFTLKNPYQNVMQHKVADNKQVNAT